MLSVLLSVLLSAVACLKTSQVTASRPRPLRLRLTFDTMSAVTPLKTSNIFYLEYHRKTSWIIFQNCGLFAVFSLTHHCMMLMFELSYFMRLYFIFLGIFNQHFAPWQKRYDTKFVETSALPLRTQPAVHSSNCVNYSVSSRIVKLHPPVEWLQTSLVET